MAAELGHKRININIKVLTNTIERIIEKFETKILNTITGVIWDNNRNEWS